MAMGVSAMPIENDASAERKGYQGSFALMSLLFFFWGFMTVFNDILIPRFKEAFSLSYFEAMLVQFAFFGAYFVGALLYFFISIVSGDPIARIGYKNGVVLGLSLAAIGSLMFLPAASAASYPLFLIALFVVGLGFAMLQIAANPYVTVLGPEKTASSRLNLAQGFNSIGTTLGPLVGGFLIFQYFQQTGAHGADSVKMPYLGFCCVFALLAVLFFFVKLPQIGEGKIERGAGALRYPHVVLGIVGIFMYVGAEVSVGSSIISFLGLDSIAGLSEVEASQYVSLFWGGMLIGRFMGAAQLSDLSSQKKSTMLIALPAIGIIALAVFVGIDYALRFTPFFILAWALFTIGSGKTSRTLLLFAGTAAALLAISIVTSGKLALWSVIGVGLFSSIGWSNTFSLAIQGVGHLKSQASSLLVMAIVGGALLPPLQGWLADAITLQWSFIVPLCAYAYVAFYGWRGYRIGRADMES
ncbi:sugar MFS transporter [Pelagicoccus albus]|uniref:Sugar MFS transporter n=1 Tax=Pelagicoccus albus TaxID=415222 RepID=A0A7X1B8H5_9BACT|nr:sugar MFS transporter [Pelagicoccus albus]MBC2607516.1 sugar MFS transporter [Pelagicoccus albus]